MPDIKYRITTLKGGRRHGQTLWLDHAKLLHKITHMGYSEIYKVVDGIAVYQHTNRGDKTALHFLQGKTMKK